MSRHATGGKAILHSLFELQDNSAEPEFRAAFDYYVNHLIRMGFARSGRVMRRQPLDGFGAKLPDFGYYAAIEFDDLEREQACYDYVARNDEPVRSIHGAMNSKVKHGSAHFFVSCDF
jgi:hypothetical protein